MRADSLAASLGWRYAFARRSSLSFIGNVAICGLALSIAVLVIVVSVINGFERELERRVFAVLPHLGLYGREPLPVSGADLEALETLPGVVGVAPIVQAVGLAAGADKVQPVLLNGIEPERHGRVSGLDRFIETGGSEPGPVAGAPGTWTGNTQRGRATHFERERGAPGEQTGNAQPGKETPATALEPLRRLQPGAFRVILGARLAARLGVGPGDRVTLVVPMANVTPAGAFPRQKRFVVAGLLRSASEFDNRAAIVHLDDARRLLRLGARMHGYQVRLREFSAARRTASESLALLGHDRFSARTWMQTHGNLHHAIRVQKTTMFVLLAFLVGVAAFNLVSTLVMAVEQRGPDIAILKTMGAATGSLVGGFILLGALIGGIGVAAGLLVGAAGASALPGLFEWISATFAPDLMSRYFINYLPVDVRAGDLAAIGGTAFALCVLCTAPPARRAAGLLPREVLAHE